MRTIVAATVVLICGCAHSPSYDPLDPLEPANRAIYGFNETLDRYVARPVAKGYTAALPSPVRSAVGNFIDNLTYPTVIANDLLQGKFAQAGRDTGRLLLNSSYGVGGLFDPATRVGLERNDEDFGQTLGYWGIGPGWFLMLPVLGPSTNRDLVGRVGSAATSPMTYADTEISVPLAVLGAVEARAHLLGTERILEQQFDRYAFVRGAYLQHRRNAVYDGSPPPEEDDWYDAEN